jgi:hypothetical protein
LFTGIEFYGYNKLMDASWYSLVIVNDEPEIREGIRDTISWEDRGFSFAGACATVKWTWV